MSATKVGLWRDDKISLARVLACCGAVLIWLSTKPSVAKEILTGGFRDVWVIESYIVGEELEDSPVHKLSFRTSNLESIGASCSYSRLVLTFIFSPKQWLKSHLAPTKTIHIAFDDHIVEEIPDTFKVRGSFDIRDTNQARALLARMGQSKRLQIVADRQDGQTAYADIDLGRSDESVARFLAACDEIAKKR